MSREIKFRAWVNDHWVDWIPTCKTLGAYNANIIDTDGYTFEEDNPFIVEQSTLFKDKNDKEIYEGDILETCCGKAEVYFDDELLMYRIKVKHGGTMPLVSKKSKRHFDYEIIGNTHENPELVGGEE